jgi:hypothetical protein
VSDDEDTRTILESFGKHPEPFTCAACGEARRYYDMLSDSTMLCLECSAKGGFEHDLHVAINVRDPELMLQDPELIAVRKSIVSWELSKGAVPLGDAMIPQTLADELVEIALKEKSSLSILVTTALSMMVQSYHREEKNSG